VWQESGGRINSTSELSDPKKFVEEHKGEQIDGRIS
jgi:staphylococcal nuclease domain-containing protein 1